MKDLSQRCIFNNTTENLNTIMEVTLDGNKYKVAISDEHEDDASPGVIKKLIPPRLAILEKEEAETLSKLDKLKQLAAELGFHIVKNGPKSAMASEPPPTLEGKPSVDIDGKQFKIQKNTRKHNKANEGLSKEEAAAALDATKRRAESSASISNPTQGEAATYASHNAPEAVTVQTSNGPKTIPKPQVGTKTLQTVKGRAGVPTTIPRSLHGADGQTTITIVDTGGDKTIQARGKQLAQMRQHGDQSYYSRACPPCQGTGFHAKRQCKTCDGVGFII